MHTRTLTWSDNCLVMQTQCDAHWVSAVGVLNFLFVVCFPKQINIWWSCFPQLQCNNDIAMADTNAICLSVPSGKRDTTVRQPCLTSFGTRVDHLIVFSSAAVQQWHCYGWYKCNLSLNAIGEKRYNSIAALFDWFWDQEWSLATASGFCFSSQCHDLVW